MQSEQMAAIWRFSFFVHVLSALFERERWNEMKRTSVIRQRLLSEMYCSPAIVYRFSGNRFLRTVRSAW